MWTITSVSVYEQSYLLVSKLHFVAIEVTLPWICLLPVCIWLSNELLDTNNWFGLAGVWSPVSFGLWDASNEHLWSACCSMASWSVGTSIQTIQLLSGSLLHMVMDIDVFFVVYLGTAWLQILSTILCSCSVYTKLYQNRVCFSHYSSLPSSRSFCEL